MIVGQLSSQSYSRLQYQLVPLEETAAVGSGLHCLTSLISFLPIPCPLDFQEFPRLALAGLGDPQERRHPKGSSYTVMKNIAPSQICCIPWAAEK